VIEGARVARILLLEDSALDAELMGEHLRRAEIEHRFDRVWTRADFAEALERQSYDLIIADYVLPSFDGLTAFDMAHARRPDTPFIFVSGTLDEEMAVDAMRRGATDYVVKHRLSRLPVAVRRALAEANEKAARRKAEQRQALLINELNHRVKNSLATVQAIAQQTLRAPEVPEAPRRAFSDRLLALARAHDILTDESWESADIRDVVAGALEPFGGGNERRFHIEGPPLRLSPKVALSFALALHELATNAAKYGALSVPQGRIEVIWNLEGLDGARRLRLRWVEKDGPLVAPPSRKGFGSRLIERGLAGELRGSAQVSYPPSGVMCEIDASFPETHEI